LRRKVRSRRLFFWVFALQTSRTICCNDVAFPYNWTK